MRELKEVLYSEIEDLIYSYIQNDMTEKIDFIELKGKVADDFKTLRSMALDLNNYFNSFLSNLQPDEMLTIYVPSNSLTLQTIQNSMQYEERVKIVEI